MGIRPEAVRLWTWQAVAQGADTVVYFRWRPSIYAQEQYHEGILKHDASPGAGYRALESLHGERQELEKLAAASRPAEVALVFDYEDLWALQIQPHRRGLYYLTHLFRLYRALQALSIPVDILPRRGDFSPYQIVIAPLAHIGDSRLAESLGEFAQAGGAALMSIRSGFKTPTNVVTDQPLPGVYTELSGIKVDQWHALAPGVQYGLESSVSGLTGAAEIWAEALDLAGAEPLVQYTEGPFAGKAALTEHHLGAGRAYYLGWHPSLTQAKVLLDHLAKTTGVTRLADALEPGLLVYRRGGKTLLMNFADSPQSARVGGADEVIVPPMDLRIVDQD
jgi:beta-galactosidase